LSHAPDRGESGATRSNLGFINTLRAVRVIDGGGER
jgi:hypothetical protein